MTLEEAKNTEYGFVATGDAQAGPVARLSATVVPLSPSRPSCCEMLKEKRSCSNVDTAILRSRWHATPQAGLHRQRGKAFCTRTSGCGSREDQSPPAARHASCLDFRSVARHFCDCPFFEQRQRAPSSHKDAAGCSQGGGYGSIDGVRLQRRHASFLPRSGKRSGACG